MHSYVQACQMAAWISVLSNRVSSALIDGWPAADLGFMGRYTKASEVHS